MRLQAKQGWHKGCCDTLNGKAKGQGGESTNAPSLALLNGVVEGV